jgi:hypothetical protein
MDGEPYAFRAGMGGKVVGVISDQNHAQTGERCDMLLHI